MELQTIPDYEWLESLSETDDETSGLGSTGSEVKKGAAVKTGDTINTGPQLQIDGDFNFANRGASPWFDVWELELSGATGTLTQEAHSSTNSKPSYAQIDITGEDDNVALVQKQEGNGLSGKEISIFMRARYTGNSPTSVTWFIYDDVYTSQGSGVMSGFTTSWAWYRLDISVSAYSTTTFTDVRMKNTYNQIWDLQVDKIRIVETNQIPAGVIPEWIKVDEPKQIMARNVREYFKRFGGYLRYAVGNGPAVSTTAARVYVNYSERMIRNITANPSYGGSWVLEGAGGNVAVTAIALSGSTASKDGCILTVSTAGSLNIAQDYTLRANDDATAYIDIDPTY